MNIHRIITLLLVSAITCFGEMSKAIADSSSLKSDIKTINSKLQIKPATIQCNTNRRISEIESEFKIKFPNLSYTSFNYSEAIGLYVITLDNGSFAYTDCSYKYLFVGIIFDTDSGNAIDGQLTGNPS